MEHQAYRGLIKEELEKLVQKYTVNTEKKIDDDIFQEVVKILKREQRKAKRKEKKNGKRAKS